MKIIWMFRYFLILLSVIITTVVSAQSIEIDSLRKDLSSTSDVQKQLDLQIELAHAYCSSDYLDSVLKYAGNVVRISKEIHDYKNQCHGYLKFALGYFSHVDNNSDTMWIYMDSAYAIASRHNYFHGITAYYQLRGIIYYFQNEFEKAVDDMLMTAKRAKQENDTIAEIYSIFNIADIYRLSGKNNKALDFLEENMALIESYEESDVYYFIQTIIGDIYMELKMYDETIPYYKKVYDHHFLISDSTYKVHILENLAYSYYVNGKKDSAKIYFQMIFDLVENKESHTVSQEEYNLLSEYLLKENDLDRAEKYMLITKKIAHDNQNSESELIVLNNLSKLYEAKKDFNLALTYMHQYMQLNDSLKLEGIDYIMDKALSDKELQSRINELNVLKSAQASLVKKQNIIYFFVILSLLFFLIIWYLLAGMLYHFNKIHPTTQQLKSAKTRWTFVSPAITFNRLNAIIHSLLFAVLNFLSLLFFYHNQIAIILLILWSIFSASIFYSFEKMVYWIQARRKNTTNKFELFLMLFASGISITIIAVSSYFSGFAQSTTLSFIAFYLLILGNAILIQIINTFSLYRFRAEIQNETLLRQFNEQLSLHRQTGKTETLQNEIITIEDAGKNTEIDLSNVFYIVSENVYQEFVSLINGKESRILVRNTLSSIEKELTEHSHFIRCHRSFIVNTKKVKSIEGNSRQYYLLFENIDEKIPISRSSANQVLEEFTRLTKS